MRWLIVEDALRDRRGHWLEYVSTFVRGLRVLGDGVEVLCDRRAEGFVLEQTGARPVLPESIWHRMGDGAGAVVRYSRVPGHAIATFFAMRKVFEEFNHNRARGQVRERATGGWSEGRVSGNERVKGHRGFSHGDTANTAIEAGQCLDKPSGADFSNPFASELGRDSENTALTRSASDPALAAEPLIADEGALIADESKLVSSSTKEKALDAGRWSLDSGEAPDWILVPTVLVHHLLGWWMLLKTGAVPKESRLLLFFPNLPIRLEETGRPHWMGGPTTKLMAWLFERLRGEVENGKVVLGVETHAMRRALEGLIRMRVVYLPHPVEFPAEARRRGDFFGNHERHEIARMEGPGPCLAGKAGAAFSNPSTSELARDSENKSLIRSADAPASSAPATSYPPFAASASPIVFGCYGAARWEKGSDIFQEAVRLILRAAERPLAEDGSAMAERRVAPEDRRSETGCRTHHGSWSMERGVEEKPEKLNDCFPTAPRSTLRALRFAIQWVEDFRDGEGNLVSIDPWLRDHPQVEVIGRYFEGDEYGRRLAQTDVMVLPYRKPYGLRVSRVVIEAMLNGMPVVATRGTTLFGQAEEFGVVVGCDDGDAESLAGAMLEAAARFESLRADAVGKTGGAAAAFSVKCFRDFLVAKKIGGENSLDALHSLDN